MDLLLQELKKIWRPVLLVAIVLLGLLYYFLFAGFYMQHFSNGSEAEASFTLSAQWAKKYGTTIEPAERAAMDSQLEQEKALFAQQLTAFDEPKQYGFSDWESFAAFKNEYHSRTSENDGKADMGMEEVIWKMIGGTNFYTIQTLMSVMQSYDYLAEDIPPNLGCDDIGDSAAAQEKILSRVNAIKDSSMVHGYLPSGILDSTNFYAKDLAVWSVLSVILLLSPTLVRDRLRRTRSMQWSSKKGRRILNVQFAAAGISSAVLSAINLIVYAVPFLLQHPLIFKDFSLFSFQIFQIPWFDWTYGQYLLIVAAMIFILAMASGGLAVFLSQCSGNYVAMMLKTLPLFAVLAFVLSKWLINFPFFEGSLSRTLALPGAEAIFSGLIAVLSIGLRVFACRRQLRCEL